MQRHPCFSNCRDPSQYCHGRALQIDCWLSLASLIFGLLIYFRKTRHVPYPGNIEDSAVVGLLYVLELLSLADLLLIYFRKTRHIPYPGDIEDSAVVGLLYVLELQSLADLPVKSRAVPYCGRCTCNRIDTELLPNMKEHVSHCVSVINWTELGA